MSKIDVKLFKETSLAAPHQRLQDRAGTITNGIGKCTRTLRSQDTSSCVMSNGGLWGCALMTIFAASRASRRRRPPAHRVMSKTNGHLESQ